MAARQDVQDATGRVRYLPGRGTMQAWGGDATHNTTGLPVNLEAGFAPGCVWQNPKGSGPGQCLFVNVGTFASSGWVNIDGGFSPPRAMVATTLSTVGAGTITAAGIVGGITVRTGAQSGTPFTDTTATGAQIQAAIGSYAFAGMSWLWYYVNQTDATATISAGATGVTVSGITSAATNTTKVFLVTLTAANTVTMVGISSGATT